MPDGLALERSPDRKEVKWDDRSGGGTHRPWRGILQSAPKQGGGRRETAPPPDKHVLIHVTPPVYAAFIPCSWKSAVPGLLLLELVRMTSRHAKKSAPSLDMAAPSVGWGM